MLHLLPLIAAISALMANFIALSDDPYVGLGIACLFVPLLSHIVTENYGHGRRRNRFWR